VLVALSLIPSYPMSSPHPSHLLTGGNAGVIVVVVVVVVVVVGGGVEPYMKMFYLTSAFMEG